MITNLSIGHYGRFGNQLFQIAGAIGIARSMGDEFGFRPWINHDHKERFGSKEDIDLQKYFVNPLPGIEGWTDNNFNTLNYDWGYDPKLPNRNANWNITGHFQSEKYFKNCVDEVRHYFDMKRIKNDDVFYDTVAVHIRRGDYDDKYHTRLGGDYYEKAMEQFPKGTTFVIYSDDQNILNEDYMGRLNRRFGIIRKSAMPDYMSDWARMKRSEGFICGNSSYSLMAAILSEAPNKKIICPSNWFGPAWNPDTKDLYPEGAIVI